MHDFWFRSREAILEADDEALMQDIARAPDKAQKKLEAIRKRLQGAQEQAAKIAEAEIKLAAAIVGALLMTSQR